MRAARYLATRFAAAVALVWCLLAALVLAVGFVEGTGALGRDAGGAEAAFWLSALAAVQLGWQLLPVATLLGLVVATTQLARSGELLGLLALGTSPARLAAPFVVVASVVAALGWASAEHALPPLARLHARLRAHVTHRVDAWSRAFGQKQHWFRVGDSLVYLPRDAEDEAQSDASVADGGQRAADGGGACFARPSVYRLRDGRLVGVDVAEALCWAHGGWRLHRAVHVGAFAGAPVEPPAVANLPRELARTHGPPTEHEGPALRALIRRREAAGLLSRGHRIEAQHRRAHPALCLAWVLLALPYALRPGRGRSLVAELGAAAALVGATFAAGQLGRLLVHAAVLPAAAGSWLGTAAVCAAVPWVRKMARPRAAR